MRLLYVIGFVIVISRMNVWEVHAQEPPQPFVDVASVAGVAEGLTGRGVAWGDYNNDGWVDLAITHRGFTGPDAPNRLYQNTRAGAFTEVARMAGLQMRESTLGHIWGDYDNDGDLDGFMMVLEGVNRLYRNTGKGRFEEVGALAGVAGPGPGLGAAWGDYDRDGWLDLYVTNGVKEQP